jgi:hypothetical protein
MTAENLHELITAKAASLLKAYQDDLRKHDLEAIQRNGPSIPFLHYTRKWGTHLIPLYPAGHAVFPPEGQKVPYLFSTSGRGHILWSTLDVAKYLDRVQDLRMVLYWDGQELSEIDGAKAIEIAERYCRQIELTWANQGRARLNALVRPAYPNGRWS